MCSNLQVYVGAYLEILTPEKDREVDYWGCLTCEVEFDTKKRFCSNCGTELTTLKKTCLTHDDKYDLFPDENDLDLLHDVFVLIEENSQDKIILLLNTIDTEGVEFNSDKDGGILDLTDVDRKSLISTFAQRSKEGLECLDKNKVSYQIKFGVITYWD